ncbi:hypothetical protein M8J76_003038 [Diaphorina citri]|nr:hypothetical protein M8J76_003038 [Diaphorina citri]
MTSVILRIPFKVEQGVPSILLKTMYLQNPQSKIKEHISSRITEVNVPIPIGNSVAPWPKFSGIFVGTSVIVENTQDAALLLNHGCFGKSSFTRGRSGFEKYSILRKRQWKRRKQWQSEWMYSKKNNVLCENNIPCLDCNTEDHQQTYKEEETEENTPGSSNHLQRDRSTSLDCCDKIFPKSKQESNLTYEQTMPKYTANETQSEVIVVNDSDDECMDARTFVNKLNPTWHAEPILTVQETLCLTFEEAFFLSFALHCITIKHMSTKQVLYLNDLWKLFINNDPNFVEKYVTYHYFRSKGWIVKSGLNFGCDFALYKRGPAYYHASCLVKIRNLNHQDKPKLSWEHMMGYCRVSEAAKKDFVVCEVTWPMDTTRNSCNVNDISKFSVAHKILQRWTASEHRET